jgi:dihydropteroate synthase
MGIVNVTPDSFSGDGLALDVDAALRLAVQMREEGADIIDVGGESTRPSADELPGEEEMRRVLPVIKRLANELDIPISVDTYKADVARAALDAGAHMINDVHGFRHDPEIARLAAETGVPAVAMHNQRGRDFRDTIGDIVAASGEPAPRREQRCQGGDRGPGFGFGWTVEQNLEMLRRLQATSGRPIRLALPVSPPSGPCWRSSGRRTAGRTAASVAISIASADIVRVHDVSEMARVVRVADAIVRG